MTDRREALRERLDVLMAYRRVFCDEFGHLTPDARTVMRDLMRAAHCDDAVPLRDDHGRLDMGAHVYRDGQRSVIAHLDQRMREDPHMIQLRLSEEE